MIKLHQKILPYIRAKLQHVFIYVGLVTGISPSREKLLINRNRFVDKEFPIFLNSSKKDFKIIAILLTIVKKP